MNGNAGFEMPLARKDCPKFGTTDAEFEEFFNNVEEYGRRAGLGVKDTIKWARRYAKSEADSWQYVPCLENDKVPAQFSTFREEVRKCYPQLSRDQRFMNSDLGKLVGATSDRTSMDREELGEYYRKFRTISSFLKSKGKLSDRERNSAYLRGLPYQVRD
jgi:hypothetical protein